MHLCKLINRFSQISNLRLWCVVFELCVTDCNFCVVTCYVICLSLFPSTLSCLGSTCSRLPLCSTWYYYVLVIWIDTWRYKFIMDYEIMKLDVVHWSLNLVFLTATWFDTFHVLYLSLPALTKSHLDGNCSWLQLYSTWYSSSIVIWISTWCYNFSMDYEIMKLYVGH